MKEFKCSSLGFKDRWKHTAHTEDLLLDTVALHLREAHGMNELSPEMLTRIRNAFSPLTSADAAAVADLIMQEYNCDQDPVCTWRYFAQNEDVIVAGAKEHLREMHGVEQVTEAMTKKVKKAIRPFRDKQKAA